MNDLCEIFDNGLLNQIEMFSIFMARFCKAFAIKYLCNNTNKLFIYSKNSLFLLTHLESLPISVNMTKNNFPR